MLSSFVYFKLAFERKFLFTDVTLKRFSTVHENIMSCKSLLVTECSFANLTFCILFDSKVNGLNVSAQIFFS